MRETLAAVTLDVEPAPVQSTDTTEPAAATLRRPCCWWVLGCGLLLITALAPLWHRRRALRAAWERKQSRLSEPGLFAQLLEACHAGDARVTYNALLRWLDVRHRGPDAATIEAFLACHPDPDLRRHVEGLQAFVLGQGARWDGVTLADGLRPARRRELRQSRLVEKAGLPPLNPP